jgi:hypothetical protein
MAGWGKKKERNRVLTRKSGRNEGKNSRLAAILSEIKDAL